MNKFDFGYKHSRTGNWFFYYFNHHWGVIDQSWAEMESVRHYKKGK